MFKWVRGESEWTANNDWAALRVWRIYSENETFLGWIGYVLVSVEDRAAHIVGTTVYRNSKDARKAAEEAAIRSRTAYTLGEELPSCFEVGQDIE